MIGLYVLERTKRLCLISCPVLLWSLRLPRQKKTCVSNKEEWKIGKGDEDERRKKKMQTPPYFSPFSMRVLLLVGNGQQYAPAQYVVHMHAPVPSNFYSLRSSLWTG
jgi:hypothetical protein